MNESSTQKILYLDPFSGIAGEGSFEAPHGMTAAYDISYTG